MHRSEQGQFWAEKNRVLFFSPSQEKGPRTCKRQETRQDKKTKIDKRGVQSSILGNCGTRSCRSDQIPRRGKLRRWQMNENGKGLKGMEKRWTNRVI